MPGAFFGHPTLVLRHPSGTGSVWRNQDRACEYERRFLGRSPRAYSAAVLVPMVGPDVTVVNDGSADQTFSTLIGQRLVERWNLSVPPGMTTMDEAVAAFVRERGQDEIERLYRVINDIIVDVDPEPGDALRDLAAIDDLRYVREHNARSSAREGHK